MVPDSADDAVRAIAEDRTSSASTLARLALGAMGLAIAEAKGRPDGRDLAAIAGRISEAQPAMAIVHNVAHLVAQLTADGQEPKAVLEHVRSELETARDRIARTFLKIAPPHGTIVTLSHSENVLAAIEAAHSRSPIARVYVMESRPLFEGRTIARALGDRGVPTTLVVDALGPALMADATCALVGADSILRDGAVINKIGTYALGLAAVDAKKPLYVACETLKFDARHDATSWPGSPERDPKEVLDAPSPAELLNRYFEVTPGRLVHTFVTERGTYAPDVVRTMLSPARRDD